jgi:hypothetical protein
LAEFLLSIVANVLTIWGFGQQQDTNRQAAIDKETEETQTTKLVGKWNSTLDDLNTRMDDIKRSLRELNCRLDAPQAIKTKGVVSQECLQYVQPLVLPSTRILLAPKQTSLLKKTDILSTPQYWLGLFRMPLIIIYYLPLMCNDAVVDVISLVKIYETNFKNVIQNWKLKSILGAFFFLQFKFNTRWR